MLRISQNLSFSAAHQFQAIKNHSTKAVWEKVAAIGTAIGFIATFFASLKTVYANEGARNLISDPRKPTPEASHDGISKADATPSNTLDIELLNDLLAQSINSTGKIEGKEPVLFIGNTGSSKSTNLNYVFGHEMEVRGYDPESSLLSENPDASLRHVLAVKGKETFPIGHGIGRSETLFMQTETTKEGLCLCDTPGFGDTRGLAYELATSYNIYQTSQIAKKIKGLVVMIPYNSFEVDRADSFKNLTRTLGTFLTNPEECKESIFFVITRTRLVSSQSKWPLSKIRWNVETFPRERIIGELKELSKNLSGSTDHSKLAAKKIVDFMIKNKSNIISDFDPLDKGQSRSALTKRLKECPGIDKTQFNPDLIGGDKRLLFQEQAIDRLKMGSQALDLRLKVIEASTKKTNYESDLAQASTEESLDPKQIEKEQKALLEEQNKAEKKKTELKKQIDQRNVRDPIEHWREVWRSNAWWGSDFGRYCVGSKRFHDFHYRGIPVIKNVVSNLSKHGFWGELKKDVNIGADTSVRLAARTGQLSANFAHAAVLLSKQNTFKLAAVVETLDHAIQRLDKACEAIATRPEKMSLLPEYPPVEIKIATDEPELGLFAATASVETNGSNAKVRVMNFVETRHKPEIKTEIGLLQTELDNQEEKIHKLKNSRQELEVIGEKAKVINFLRSMILEEEQRIKNAQEALEKLHLNDGELMDIKRLAEAINRLKGLNITPGLPNYYLEKYKELFSC